MLKKDNFIFGFIMGMLTLSWVSLFLNTPNSAR